VHRYHRPVFAYLYRLCGQQQTAEDLTQETFARLLTRMQSYRFPQPFKPWLYTIAHNLFKDHCKRAANRMDLPAAVQPDGMHSPIDLSERIAERMAVTAALQAMEPQAREVLLLRFSQDLKVDEIAVIVGVPPGTIKSRLFNAVQKMRTLLQSEGRGRHESSGR
jgi:RNA polymerase sigma-70 factor (ECF subfamily)